MNRILRLLPLPGLLLGCAVKTSEYVPYSHRDARFWAEVPSDWAAIENPEEDIPGVQFLSPAPRGRRAVRPYISADFYAARNRRFSTPEAFLADAAREGPGRSRGPISDARLAGLPAREFSSRRPLPQSPEFAPQGTLALRTLVLTAPEGFYVLVFAAPEGATSAAAAFQRFRDSFRPR